MKLLVPANSKQLSERATWFKNPKARKLAEEKKVEFGFELKGEPETITQAPPLFWGYHIPNTLAVESYYHPEKQEELLKGLEPIAKLKPHYVNFHGIKLWWKPEVKEYIGRFRNRSTPEEYLKILEGTVSLIKKIKNIFPNVTLENAIIYDYYRHDEDILAETSYQTTCGAFKELLYLKEKVEILLDIEHLILTLNFLLRKKNYRYLKKEKINLTSCEKKVSEIFGYKIKKGYIPYIDSEIKLGEMIKKIGAKKYHLTGTTQDVIFGKKDLVAHGLIEKDNKVFRKNLRLVLAEKPETILVETASVGDNACFKYLRPNETELSFYELCEILLEEL